MQHFFVVFYVEDVKIKKLDVYLCNNFFLSFTSKTWKKNRRKIDRMKGHADANNWRIYICDFFLFFYVKDVNVNKQKIFIFTSNIYVCVYQKGHADVNNWREFFSVSWAPVRAHMNTFGSMILDTIGINSTRARVQVLSLLKQIHVNYLRLRVPFGRRRRKYLTWI